MATYYLNRDNPRLYNQSGKVHGDSPLKAAKGSAVTITGVTLKRDVGYILPLGNGTYLHVNDVTTMSTPTPEPDDSTEPPPPPVEPSPVSGDLWQLLPSNGDGEPDPRQAAQTLGSAPDIVVLRGEGAPVQLTKAWQLYLVALNPNMKRNNVSGLLGSKKALTNNSGFPTDKRPQKRANYILGEDLQYGNPYFDKVRSCAYNCHQGVEVNGVVTFVTLDGNEPPPPIAEVNPRSHPHLFFHATIVYRDGIIDPFPKGAPAWGYTRNVVLMPFVSAHAVSLPVARVQRVSEYKLPYTR